jgi:hypothetical protein
VGFGRQHHRRKIRNAEWNPVECRFVSKLDFWQGKLLSYGDRLIYKLGLNQFGNVYAFLLGNT